jgi:hypothetical protein
MDIERETVSNEPISRDTRIAEATASARVLLQFMKRDPKLARSALVNLATEVVQELDALQAIDRAEAKLAANRVERERYGKIAS